LKVVYQLWLREIRRYARSRMSLFGSLAQPVLYLLALGIGLGPVYRESGRGNYLDYIVPGIVALTVLSSAIHAGATVMWDRRFGFLRQALISPAPRLGLHFGRVLGAASVACIHGSLMAAICVAAGFPFPAISQVLMACGFLVLVSYVFASLGVVIGLALYEIESFNVAMSVIVPPLFFLSGALFPPENLPSSMAFLIGINPLSYGVDGLRAALSGRSHFGAGLDVTVLATLAGCLTLTGAWQFSRAQA